MESEIVNNCKKCESKNSPPNDYSYDWSRLCPMGQFLEPKLYPVSSQKNSPPAAATTTTNPPQPYQQANIFLRNLQDISNLNKTTKAYAAYDFLRRVNEDRLRSTYQIAYGHNVEYNCLDYDYSSQSPKTEQEEEFVPCKKPLRPPYIGGHNVPGIRCDKTSIGEDFGNMKLEEDGQEMITREYSSGKVGGSTKSVKSGGGGGSVKSGGGGGSVKSGGGGGSVKSGGGAKSTERGKNTSSPGGSKYSSEKSNNKNRKATTVTQNRGGPTALTKSQNSLRGNGGARDGKDSQAMLALIDDEPRISEYQDVIDRTGEEIIFSQLHHPKPKKKTKKL